MDFDPNNDFSVICESLTKKINQVSSMKLSTDENQVEALEKLRVQGCLDIMNLKKLNRVAQERNKKFRDKTAEEKQKLDRHNLTLENLQYELAHLDKEINKCYEFRSQHEDIKLVTEEDFYKNAPKDISKPDVTKLDDHARLLARLEWELESRKRLANEANELNEEKCVKQSKIETHKKQIQDVAPLMDQMLKSCEPLLEVYGMERSVNNSDVQTANLLPAPLYTLYMIAKGHNDAFGDNDMEVSIQGDKDEALRLTDESQKKNEKESDSEADEAMDVDVDKEADRSRSKRKKKSKKKKDQEKKGSDNEITIKAHPLQVEIILRELHQDSSLKMKFSYYSQLSLTAVETKVCKVNMKNFNDEQILSCMFENDHGIIQPALFGGKVYKLPSGHAYRWVQKLCGISLLNKNQILNKIDLEESFGNIKELLSMIRKKVESSLVLNEQLESLYSKKILPIEDINKQISDKVQKWEKISWEKFKKMCQNKNLHAYETEADFGKSSPEIHDYYHAAINHHTLVLNLYTCVYSGYPRPCPYIKLSMIDSNQKSLDSSQCNFVRMLEQVVNVDLPEKQLKKNVNNILSTQLYKLAEQLEVYIETGIREGVIDDAQLGLCRVSIPVQREGPLRSSPTNYDATNNQYNQ